MSSVLWSSVPQTHRLSLPHTLSPVGCLPFFLIVGCFLAFLSLCPFSGGCAFFLLALSLAVSLVFALSCCLSAWLLCFVSCLSLVSRLFFVCSSSVRFGRLASAPPLSLAALPLSASCCFFVCVVALSSVPFPCSLGLSPAWLPCCFLFVFVASVCFFVVCSCFLFGSFFLFLASLSSLVCCLAFLSPFGCFCLRFFSFSSFRVSLCFFFSLPVLFCLPFLCFPWWALLCLFLLSFFLAFVFPQVGSPLFCSFSFFFRLSLSL